MKKLAIMGICILILAAVLLAAVIVLIHML